MIKLLKFVGMFLWHNGLRIAMCIPAVACGTAVAGFAVWCLLEDQITASYSAEAHRQFQAKNYEAARIGFERLTRLQPERPEACYGLAMTLDALGKSARAAAIMATLAPSDRWGYAPAHLWQAKRLLRGIDPTRQGLPAAEKHLQLVTRHDPDNHEAHGLLGELYFKIGRWAEAEPLLEKAARDRPELLFPLANLDLARGRRDEVRGRAERARLIFRNRVEASPDDREARGYWAAAALLLEDFAGAVAILGQGLARGDDSFYHQALAKVYATQSDALARDPKASLSDRLALLEKGLNQNPADPALLDGLVSIIRTNGVEAERGVAALQTLLANGQATELVHFALGIAAWERAQPGQARLHLEQAARMAPQMPLVANNLAWMLAHSQPPELPRALKLVDQAIAHWPNQPQCRGTRGYILVKLGRWKEALGDLEVALRAKPDDTDLHLALAETYDKLGEPDMASEHRRHTGD